MLFRPADTRQQKRSPARARRSSAIVVCGIAICLSTGVTRAAEDEAASAAAPPTVLMISLDGTRPADLTPARLPSLLAVAKKGARAEGLTPVNPTNTFPNHVSLATGVRPEVHGLVNNLFVDPVEGRFRRQNPNLWIKSEPIWSVAERHGIRAAVYFWVGSEGDWQGGPGPSESRKFNSSTLEKTKVNRLLKWLGESDPAKRPQLIMAWFHGADHASHEHGPNSAEVDDSLRPQNIQIARLIDEMTTRGLFDSTTLIFVSDHGMVLAPRRVNLSQAYREAGLSVSVMGIGGFATVVWRSSDPSQKEIARAVSVAEAAGLEAYAREQAPADWHVGDDRFGDLVVRAPVGTAIVTPRSNIEGFHGYDAQAPSMLGILVARGRGVAVGATLGRISNLSIAPTVLTLLGLPIPEQMKAPLIDELLVGVKRAGDMDAPVAQRQE